MNTIFYNGRSGALAYEKAMEVVSNNMANVNTIGFSPSRMSFSDALYTNMNAVEGTIQVALREGHGIKPQQVDVMMDQGVLQNTNRELDFAIQGDGFFGLQARDGSIYYSRAGNFQLSNQYGEYYLANAQGDIVLNQYEEQIVIPTDEYGELDLNQLEIGVFDFPNKYGLMPVGDNRYAETQSSGPRGYVEENRLRQGYLEASAVDTATEMVKIIETQRGFQFNSRIIQLADELEQTVNNLR